MSFVQHAQRFVAPDSIAVADEISAEVRPARRAALPRGALIAVVDQIGAEGRPARCPRPSGRGVIAVADQIGAVPDQIGGEWGLTARLGRFGHEVIAQTDHSDRAEGSGA